MKVIKPDLKIYCLQNPVAATEFRAIFGDKYCHSLAFNPVFTTHLGESDLIVWDGLISVKMKRILPELRQSLSQNKVLLLIEDSMTLIEKNFFVQFFDSEDYPTVKLNGWTMLPEDLLPALEQCFQKMKNV